MKAYRKVFVVFIVFIFAVSAIGPTSAAAVSASGAILMEQSSGRVLFEKNPHEVRRIASITKIMTAIVAIESGKMDRTATVSKKAVYTEGSSVYLQPDEKIKLRDLVYGLMLRSGNDAATAIAEFVGGSEEGFVFLMNQKAEEIGMSNTVFSNPHGLDTQENHFSTPYDMAILTRYAMENPEYREIAGSKVYRFNRESMVQQWTNKHRLITEKYKFTTGGKTGFTKRAGRTLVSTAAKNDIELIAVTLNASDDWNDHIGMFEKAFSAYKITSVLEEGMIKEFPGAPKGHEPYFKNSFSYPLLKDEEKAIRVEYEMLNKKHWREQKDEPIGHAIVHLHEEPIKTMPIYVKLIEQEKKSWFHFFKNLFLLYLRQSND